MYLSSETAAMPVNLMRALPHLIATGLVRTLEYVRLSTLTTKLNLIYRAGVKKVLSRIVDSTCKFA